MPYLYVIWMFTGTAILLFLSWYRKLNKHFAPLERVPGVAPTFLIGNFAWAVKIYARRNKYEPGVYISERIIGTCLLYRKYGFNKFWSGMKPLVSVYTADLAELVLSNTVSLEKSFEYNFLHKWLGTGLLTSKGEKWRKRRKLLTPTLHFRILEDFIPVFNLQSKILIRKLESLVNEDCVDIAPLIILCTLDVVCETIMGVSIDSQSGNNTEYVKAIHELAAAFNVRMVSPWLWPNFLFGLTKLGKEYKRNLKILHDFTNEVIKEKKQKLLSLGKEEKLEEDGSDYLSKKRKAFMDLLLEMHVNGQQLSEEDIREEVDTFMFEGHDTTAMGIIFALYLIGLNPEVQDKIIKELDDIFGADKERPVTIDDTRKMKYLECALKESQRIYPSVPMYGRLLEEPIHFNDFTIPSKTTIHLNILGLHRDPKYFPEPEIFDPDRFLPENSTNRHPYAYVPFSAGPRNCIGQKFAMLEEKTVIANILRHFRIVSLDHRDVFHIKVEFTLRPAQEVRLKFLPRSKFLENSEEILKTADFPQNFRGTSLDFQNELREKQK